MTKENVQMKSTPCKISEVLKRDEDAEPHDESFHYCSVIGKLSHVERCTRLDMASIVHQCARFSKRPKVIYNKANKWLGRYLRLTKSFGYVMQPDFTKGLEVFVDSNWERNWDSTKPETDVDTARSRCGFIIKFAEVPIFHA